MIVYFLLQYFFFQNKSSLFLIPIFTGRLSWSVVLKTILTRVIPCIHVYVLQQPGQLTDHMKISITFIKGLEPNISLLHRCQIVRFTNMTPPKKSTMPTRSVHVDNPWKTHYECIYIVVPAVKGSNHYTT